MIKKLILILLGALLCTSSLVMATESKERAAQNSIVTVAPLKLYTHLREDAINNTEYIKQLTLFSGSVVGDDCDVNVYKYPNQNEEVLITLLDGSVVDIVNYVNGYYEIITQNERGYIHKENIEYLPIYTGVINGIAESIPMLKEPNYDSDVLDTLKPGTQVDVLKMSGTYYLVQYNDELGFVFGGAITSK